LYTSEQATLRTLNSEREVELDKMKKKISSYVKFDETGRNIIAITKKLTDEEYNLVKSYQDTTNAVEDTTLEIIRLDNEMRNNMNTIKTLNTSVLTELQKSYEKDLENYKQAEKDKYDEFKKNKEARIREIDDELDKLRRLYEDNEYLEDQEDLAEQIAHLEKEKAMLATDNSLWAKQRKQEIDEEMLKIKQQMNKNERKQNYELEKRKLEDQKQVLQEELRVYEEKMNQRMEVIERNYETLLTELEGFTENWQSLGNTFGEAFENGLMPFLENIRNQINSLLSGTPLEEFQMQDSSNSSNSDIFANLNPGESEWVGSTQYYKGHDGKKYKSTDGGATWEEVHHEGLNSGFVGGKPIDSKHNEVRALLEKGELLINSKQLDNIYNKTIKPIKVPNPTSGFMNEIKNLLNIETMNIINNDAKYDIRRTGKDLAKYTNEQLLLTGVR